MRCRSAWSGLLAISAALAACNDGSTTSESEADSLVTSPGKRIAPRVTLNHP